MGGKARGVTPAVSSSETGMTTALERIAGQQNQRAGELFDIGLPGVKQAEQFYGSLSTGDPFQISRAIAPDTQQITKATESAKANILANAPPGGEKNLALENAEVARGAAVGDVATKGYLGSFNALASLGGQNIQQSQGAAGTAIGAYGTGGQIIGQLGSQQLEQQKINAELKGAEMAAFAKTAESAATMGAAG